MDTAARPPDEVFCLQCGPGVLLQPDRQARLLRCPGCGTGQRLAAYPLFVVTGASGTGKSTIVEPLRLRLTGCEVFDTDVILHVAALGWDTWRNTWLQLAHAIALNGRATVLCGSLVPAQLEALPARRLVGPAHFCNLDCPDAVLANRLRTRPAWRDLSSETKIAEHQHFAAWLRERIQPTIDTSMLCPDDVADRVTKWIRPLLAAAKLDRISPATPAK